MTETIDIIDPNVTKYKEFIFKWVHHSEKVYNKIMEIMTKENSNEYIIKKLEEIDKYETEVDTNYQYDDNIEYLAYTYTNYTVDYLTNFGNIYNGKYSKYINKPDGIDIGKIYSCNENKIFSNEQIDLIITRNFNYSKDTNTHVFRRHDIEKQLKEFLKTGVYEEYFNPKKKRGIPRKNIKENKIEK